MAQGGFSTQPPSDPLHLIDIDRTHCPTDEEVKAVAQGESTSEAFEQHLAQCSACRRELKDHRAQFEWERVYQKTKWLLYAILLIILGSIAVRASHDGFGW